MIHRRKLIAGAAVALALPAIIGRAQAQSMLRGIGSDVPTGGGGGGSLTWTTPASNTAFFTSGGFDSTTFTGVGIGTASSDRVVVVCIGTLGSSPNMMISSVTIGGVTATSAVDPYIAGDTKAQAIWFANVPTGTTANIVINDGHAGGWLNESVIAVGLLYGSATASVASTQTLAKYPGAAVVSSSVTNSASVTCGAGQIVAICGVAIVAPSGGTQASTWTGTTSTSPDTETTDAANLLITMAHATAGGTITEVMNHTSSSAGWVSATFQP